MTISTIRVNSTISPTKLSTNAVLLGTFIGPSPEDNKPMNVNNKIKKIIFNKIKRVVLKIFQTELKKRFIMPGLSFIEGTYIKKKYMSSLP